MADYSWQNTPNYFETMVLAIDPHHGVLHSLGFGVFPIHTSSNLESLKVKKDGVRTSRKTSGEQLSPLYVEVLLLILLPFTPKQFTWRTESMLFGRFV